LPDQAFAAALYAQREPMGSKELGYMAKSQLLASHPAPAALEECQRNLQSAQKALDQQKQVATDLKSAVKKLVRELAACKAQKKAPEKAKL
jgi:hypothetical protein